VRALVHTVGGAILVGIGLVASATAHTRIGLERLHRASVDAIGSAILVRVSLELMAAASASDGLVDIVRTTIVAVRGSITIGILLGYATTTIATRGDLVGIVRADVVAVRSAIPVLVLIGDFATADAFLSLPRVAGAAINAVGISVFVSVGLRIATTAVQRSDLLCVIWAGVGAVWVTIAI